MRFVQIPKEESIRWGREIRRIMSDKICRARPVKAEALKIGMELEDPHEYYQTTQAVELQRCINEDTDMGKTTRDRWKAERLDAEEKHVNKTRMQKKALEKCGFHLRKNNHKDEKIPVREGEYEEDTTWESTIIGGDNVRITTNNWGIWGNGMETGR